MFSQENVEQEKTRELLKMTLQRAYMSHHGDYEPAKRHCHRCDWGWLSSADSGLLYWLVVGHLLKHVSLVHSLLKLIQD